MSDILYNPFWYSEEEIALLKEHDEGEDLHAFVQEKAGPFWACRTCGDTEEGLMHNNTLRNIQPLMED